MTKTYAAFYLPPEEKEAPKTDESLISKFSNSLTGAWKNLTTIVSNNDYEMLKDIARNMNIQGGTEFTQRYAVGALTDIINGRAVTNKTMLDSLFNTYAPALNAGLAQSEFNSLVEMRNAVKAGNINVSNFVQGLSSGLTAIQNTSEQTNYSKYGEEIPIDVVTSCFYEYSLYTGIQQIDPDETFQKYVADLNPLALTIEGHIKNENAELWTISDINAKIVDCMANKTKIYVRIGKSIYEDCIFFNYNPIIESIYDLSFKTKLYLNYGSVSQSYQSGEARIMNIKPPVGDFDRQNYNLAATEVYKGIIT